LNQQPTRHYEGSNQVVVDYGQLANPAYFNQKPDPKSTQVGAPTISFQDLIDGNDGAPI